MTAPPRRTDADRRRVLVRRAETAPGGATAATTVVVHVDGASRGNPGEASIGAVLEDARGHVLRRISRYIGRTTNNVAEYTALVEALRAAADLGAQAVTVFADSELVVRQMAGQYRVRDARLRLLHAQACAAAARFTFFRIQHVPRAENSEADALAQAALDTRRASP